MKIKRIFEWAQAVRAARPNLPALVSMALIPSKEGVAPKRTWHHRMHQCVRCPIYGQAKKTCGLCGCYVPIKAMFKDQECPNQIEDSPFLRKWRS